MIGRYSILCSRLRVNVFSFGVFPVSWYCLMLSEMDNFVLPEKQSDYDETLSELFFQAFKLQVNMNRFENNFTRGIFSIN